MKGQCQYHMSRGVACVPQQLWNACGLRGFVVSLVQHGLWGLASRACDTLGHCPLLPSEASECVKMKHSSSTLFVVILF